MQETKRPSKEMQVTIARQLGLEPTTVGNFFMNARRRSMDKWKDESDKNGKQLKIFQKNKKKTLNISFGMVIFKSEKYEKVSNSILL